MGEENQINQSSEDKDVVGLESEVLVPKEEINGIVTDFCNFYNTDISKEQSDFKIEIIKEKEWNEKLRKKEILSAIGLDSITVTDEDISKYSRTTIPYGEWITRENQGYLVDLSNTTWNTQTKEHIIVHELVHGISFRKNGGFIGKNYFDQIKIDNEEDSDDYLCISPSKINEAATELLALGLTKKTKDLKSLREVVEKRLRNVIDKNTNENSIEDLPVYIIETLGLIKIMEFGDVTLQNLCNYYLKGDRNILIKKVRDIMVERYSRENKYSDENYENYSDITENLGDLDISIRIP